MKTSAIGTGCVPKSCTFQAVLTCNDCYTYCPELVYLLKYVVTGLLLILLKTLG